MKKFFSLLLAFMLALPLFANEGMWLPLLLNRNFAEMQKLGLQLTPEELYSVNNSSLKDAIVSFGGFCTGEIISPNGLILTNHHCGYSSIQSHSSVENDYLSDGFWAHSYSEEKPNEGLFVRFLVRMEDVSERVNTELTAEMTESERDAKIAEISKQIADEAATEENGYEANVKSFYHGNEFYLFVYERYNDVRLVGAPPSSIGKFGGDTDNWMWPRHTGDFSLFRVYTAPDGSPADYSEENIPMKPKHYLPVSLDGVKEGDFTMIFGYPGSTDRYLSSYGVKQAIDKYNPTVVKIRDRKLEIMKKYMDADPATRIAYSSKYAQTSNYWKYYIGQTEQLKNNKVWAKKRVIEDDFSKWVSADPARQKKYGETLNLLEDAYQASQGSKQLLGIADAGHLVFSDICHITNDADQNLIEIATEAGVCGTQFASFLFDCAETALPVESGQKLVRAATTWVLEKELHCQAPTHDFGDFAVESGHTSRSVAQQNHEICFLESAFSLLSDQFLHASRTRHKTTRIHEREASATPLSVGADHITRDAWFVVSNRLSRLDNAVEERRFAYIRPTNNGDDGTADAPPSWPPNRAGEAALHPFHSFLPT